MHVTELHLSPGALAPLEVTNIADVEQLVSYSVDELIDLGITGIELYEIVCELGKRGLGLANTRSGKDVPENDRNLQMLRERIVEGRSFYEIGTSVRVSSGRVQQLLRWQFGLHRTPPAVIAFHRVKRARKRVAALARARSYKDELLAAWSDGEDTPDIAPRFKLTVTTAEEIIQTNATDAQRCRRIEARRRRRFERRTTARQT